MVDDPENAFARLSSLKGDLEDELSNPLNESATRFRVLDRILIEGLGWKHDNIEVEAAVTDGFIDYTLCAPDGTALAVIEAKRVGRLQVGSASAASSSLALRGTVLKTILAPIRQALGYAAERGVPIACVTDGRSWLFFQTNRRDGRGPLEGKGLFFPSLPSILNNFPRFHDLLSPSGIAQRLSLAQLNRAEGLVASGEEEQAFVSPPDAGRLHERSGLAQDASLLFKQFFSKITNDSDPEMLTECFVETGESQKADLELQKITQKLLNGIVQLDTQESKALQGEVERALSTFQSDTVLIVGNKGAGKSTYLTRFFGTILPPQLRNSCVLLRVSLEKCPRNERDRLSEWALRQLRDQVEMAVCKGERASFDELRGVFFSEYQRQRDGSLEHLYKSDPTAFRAQFGGYLERYRENEPEGYVKAFLDRAVASDHRLPVIIFDNADNYSPLLQNEIFQLAHAIGESSSVLNIVPITDRTVWRLSKAGALQSYPARSFYLPVPEAKQILRKRIDYVKRRLNDDPDMARRYFSQKGFTITLSSIDKFAQAVERVFVQNDFVSGLIGRLANFDIRRMLEIAERIFLSPEIKIDDVLRGSFGLSPGPAEVLRIHRALVKGEYDRYSEKDNPFVLNLFWTDRVSPASPLIAFYLLWILRQRLALARSESIDSRHWTAGELARFFESTGTSIEQTLVVLQRLRDRVLVEPLDPNTIQVSSGDRLAITEAGVAHIELCLTSSVYLEQMAMATGLNSRAVFEEIRRLRDQGNARSFEDIRRAFVDYVVELDTVRIGIPSSKDYDAVRDAKKQFKGRGGVSTTHNPPSRAAPPRSAPAPSIGRPLPRRR